MTYRLFPVPRKLAVSQQKVDLSASRWVVVDPRFSATLKKHLLTFCECAQRMVQSNLGLSAATPQKGGIFLNVRLTPDKNQPQGYTLICRDSGLVLEAQDEAGAFYGLQTLRQIVHQTTAGFHKFHIADFPDFPSRGYMLDISRTKVPTMESLHRLVELLGRLKINQLQLYAEHTFAFSAHEAIWHDASPMTPAQIIELDAWCKSNYIELVPNQNSFGHFERWLRHPEYFKYAECPKGFKYPWSAAIDSPWGSVLKPDNQSIKLLDSLFTELLPNFTSKNLNVGCDETWELGKGWSKPICDKKGMHRVYFDHLMKIHKLVKKHGRRMMFWADMILQKPALIKNLPRDIIALNWGYEAKHPFEKEAKFFAKSKIPFYVCPGTSSWCSLTGRTMVAIKNCANAARNGSKYGALGFLNTDWGDGGHHQPLVISYIGLLAGAGFSWCFKANEKSDLADAASRIVFRDPAGVLGKICYDLGRVYESIPTRIHNNSIFQAMLFWDDPLKTAPQMRPYHLLNSIKRLNELEARIPDAAPSCADSAIVKAELIYAIAMARCACTRGLFLLKGKSAPSKTQLRHALQQVVKQHTEVWLMRNRAGGLHESSGILRKKLEQLA
jgi:hexosaminidase